MRIIKNIQEGIYVVDINNHNYFMKCKIKDLIEIEIYNKLQKHYDHPSEFIYYYGPYNHKKINVIYSNIYLRLIVFRM